MAEQIIDIEYLNLDHADQMQILASDSHVSDTTSLPHPYPPGAATEFIKATIIKRQLREEFIFAILNKEQQFIGTCSILKCNFESSTGILGYWIGKPYWGKGFATAAAVQAIDFAFGTLKLDTLVTGCIFDNFASIKVLEKIGFTITGESELILPKWSMPKRMIEFQLKKNESKFL